MSNDKKYAFVQDLFSKNPAMAIQDANFAIKQKFGEGMRLDDIVAIKKEVKAGRLRDIPLVNEQMKGYLQGLYELFLRNVQSMTDITEGDIQLAQDVFSFLEQQKESE